MHRILLTFIFFLTGLLLFAQSTMTEAQIKEFVIAEYQKGTSEQEIVSQLLKKGATVQQIKDVRKKLEQQKKKEAKDAGKDQGSQSLRMRTHTTDTKVAPKSGSKKDRLKPVDDSWNFATDSLEWDFEMEPLEEEDSIQIFGRNIFANKDLSFEAEINIATPADYVIGVGDMVIIDIWGASQNTISDTVSPEGEIVIEGVGPIVVSGITVEEANTRLANVLGQYFKNSQIKLSIGQTKSITVNVMGEVENPGTYTLSAFSTVFHALYQAGGTTLIGTLRDIKVFRQNKLITTVDIYDYILNGKLTGNVRLQSEDVIIVGPYTTLVQAEGMVKRPMYYEMKAEETAENLLNYAGGFTDKAFTSSLRITRKENGKFSVYTLDEALRATFQLKNGDQLTVDSVLNRYNNMAEIRGAIKQPGKYQMDGSIRTLKQLIEAAGGLTEDALMGRALLHRRKQDRSIEVVAINLDKLLNGGMADIALENEDELYIHSRAAELAEYELSIYGEVVNPGFYDYADNMSVEDLIITAGGLLDAASLTRIDVARRIRNNDNDELTEIISETFSFAIHEGLIVEGDPNFTLQPFDEVYVRRAPNYIEQKHILINGEATFPGTYTITKRNYRLSDLIKAAGGLTGAAYIEGARLERRLTDDELVQQKDVLKSQNDSIDVDKLEAELKLTKYVGINLKEAIANPGNNRYDLVLQDGDILNIPQINNTITIQGEVLYPNTVVYQDNQKLKYYIKQAGGYTEKARKNKVYAVNLDGTVSIIKKAKDIKPGAQIIVPEKEPREKLNFTQYLSIFTTIAMMGSVIATLLK